MKQAEIWYADLNPVKGSEQAGYRPVVILSGNLLNEYLEIVIACPLTTKIKRYKGNPILLPNDENGLKATSEVLVFHVRSISKSRLIEKIGQIEASELDLMIKTLGELIKY
ncbi:type II toxin-antitoxin system PemK/MazF family toxin [Marivirga sp. S37H4]|uniref:mRNA interferase n=1 Tax=Marivirga aurantiaca TaxID=2802615 RepID=A0A934WVF7_9BACT|nr:type II toxin-antitoxin system PemK/MazF family toxin [Marivirga aurantiaca]MBK6263702.1 type II toxin-antitoxin system PemK/MazF family toxin [Marivirga aurantiaca]